MAVIGMFDWRIFRQMYRQNKVDWLTLMVTFLSVTFIGIERGVFIGIGFALLTHIWRNFQPAMRIELHVETLNVYVSTAIYYANAPIIQETIQDILDNNADINDVVLLLSQNHEGMDTTTIAMLESLAQALKRRDVGLTLGADLNDVEHSEILRGVIK